MSSIRGQTAVDRSEQIKILSYCDHVVIPNDCEQLQTPEELFHGGESGSIPLGSAKTFSK
jgi:hypothetical protein